MNLEKYKKFLDGLGTLKGISRPPRCGRAARRGAPAEPDHLPPIDGRWRQIESPRDAEELPASRGGSGRGGAFHGSASLPAFVLYLGLPRCVWAQRERWGSAGRKTGRAASRTTGKGIELKIPRKETEPAGVPAGRRLIRL